MSRMFRLTEEQYAEMLKGRKLPGTRVPPSVSSGVAQRPSVTPAVPAFSQIHIRMRQQIQQAGLPPPIEEYYHIKGRDFRLDFAWPDRKIGVEVQGMAHRIKGKFHADIEKRALAMLQGWRILEVSGDTVRDERGIGWLKQLLEIEEMTDDQKNCTATVDCTNGFITTKSCKTQRSLIDDGGSVEGDRDDYICPDCGKHIRIYYEG